MVNKYWLEQVQKAKQKEMIAKLKSKEVIIQGGKIVLNQAWIKKKQWKQSWQEKQAERKWQQEWSWIEWCLAELEKGGNM